MESEFPDDGVFPNQLSRDDVVNQTFVAIVTSRAPTCSNMGLDIKSVLRSLGFVSVHNIFIPGEFEQKRIEGILADVVIACSDSRTKLQRLVRNLYQILPKPAAIVAVAPGFDNFLAFDHRKRVVICNLNYYSPAMYLGAVSAAIENVMNFPAPD